MKIYQRHRGNFAQATGKVILAKQLLATPAQAMQERMKQGTEADISTDGAWYNASFNEVQGRILGTRGEFNPLIENAQKAVEAVKTGEFYLEGVLINGKPASEVLAQIAEQDAKKPIYKRRVADFGQTRTHNVPTDCFGDDDTIVFLAESKSRANKYGLWLNKKAQISQVTVYMQDLIGKDKSRGFWLGGLGDYYWSGFSCGSRVLYYEGSVFGVYESAEGTQKNSVSRESRIITPTLSDLLKYAKPFVSSRDWNDFKEGLTAKLRKQ